MRIRLSASQYRLLARYAEDLSKATALYNVVGYFLPSVLPSAVQPSILQLVAGVAFALTSLLVALILEGKAGRSR